MAERAPQPDDTDVLIAGAGPTGLVLALWLARLGVRVRVIDEAEGPGTTSRALAVQARTLELYSQLGLADEVIARGQRLTAANLWVGGERRGRAPFGEMGVLQSPFPFGLIFPQDEHERVLIAALKREGVTVERRVRLIGFEEAHDGVVAQLQPAGREATICRAAYLAGCDGARSMVRQTLGTGFPGGTYSHVFYVADVDARGPLLNGELHLFLDVADFLAVFPLATEGRARLIGTISAEAEAAATRDRDGGLSWDDVSRQVLDQTRIAIDRVNWFSTYRVHHRVASRFRGGRAFLLGDAAHIHSPVGGQGMNTGIGDAINLAWKLAAVVKGRADARLLDSYEPERIAFAQRLVATTDRVFQLATSPGAVARPIRTRVFPALVSRLFRLASVRRFMFRVVSQTELNYRGGELAEGHTGHVRGGDRLPWVPGESGAAGDDNFAPLTSLDWQAHVYGHAGPEIAAACSARGLPLHLFPWGPAAARAGLSEGALYLVRPDGYLGLVDPEAHPARLERYFEDRGLRS